jgi:hypothetical protein
VPRGSVFKSTELLIDRTLLEIALEHTCHELHFSLEVGDAVLKTATAVIALLFVRYAGQIALAMRTLVVVQAVRSVNAIALHERDLKVVELPREEPGDSHHFSDDPPLFGRRVLKPQHRKLILQ